MTGSHTDSPTRGVSIKFADVHRTFGTSTALAGLSLTIDPGEFLAILGPSGCGKTTALRMLAGFDQPTAGVVYVDGKDVTPVGVSRRDMGMVFQSYSLFPTMSALENVSFGMRVRKIPRALRRQRAGELLELVGLSSHADKFPHQLSGGQQQRVALARALAIQPRVLLLDEPLSALDALVRAQLRDEIRRIQVELGVTTVFVTHDQEEALSIADRVAVMRDGMLEQCAAPSDLYRAPATQFVAEFVGTMNHVRVVVESPATVRFNDQVLASTSALPPIGQEAQVLARPEDLIVRADSAGRATVIDGTFRGAMTRLRIRIDDDAELFADIDSHAANLLPAGTRVRVELPDRPALVSHRPASPR